MKIKIKTTGILMLIMSIAMVCLSFGMFSFKFSKNSQALEEEVANAVSANGGAMYIGSGSKVTLGSDCTISGIKGATNGGAIYVAGELTINGATISDCSAEYGGAIYIANGGKVTMNSGDIGACSASDGGAVFISSGGTFEFKGGDIFGCDSNSGGAVSNAYGIMTMSGGTFENNSAVGDGGAIYTDGGTLTITGGSFTENQAGVSGGAIYSYGANLKIQGTSTNKVFFGRNETQEEDDEYAGGGAINIYDEDYGANMAFAEMKYVTFQENRTASNGGDINLSFLGGYDYSFSNCIFGTSLALACGGAVSTTGEANDDADISFTNCSFIGTNSQNGGGAIYDYGGGNRIVIYDQTTFTDCVTGGGGGAICAVNILIDDGYFEGCEAEYDGGAVYVSHNLIINGTRDYVQFISCVADTGGSDSAGGAISMRDCDFEINNAYFECCSSYFAGAVSVVNSSGSFTFCEFQDCDQVENGALCNNASSVTIKTSDFYDCDTTDGYGGAIYNAGELYIEGGVYINSCTSTYSGGGIYATSNSDTMFDYCESTNHISGCSAANNGGAIAFDQGAWFDFGQENDLEISNCDAQNNGGGIYIAGATSTVSRALYNTEISGCSAGNSGGGVYLGSYVKLDCIFLYIESSSVTECGGGIYSGINSSLELSSSTIEGCSSDSDYGANIHFEGGPSANGVIELKSGTYIYDPIDGYNIFIYDYADVNIRSGAIIGSAAPSSNDRIYGYDRECNVYCYGGTIYSIFDVENAYISFNPTNTITGAYYQTFIFSSSSYIQLSDFVCESVTYEPYRSGTTVAFKRGTSISVTFSNRTEDRVTVQTPDGTFHSFDAGGSYSYNGAGGNFGVTCYNFSTTFKIKIDSRQNGVIGYIYSDSSAASGSGSTILNLTASDEITFTMIRANAIAPGGVDDIPEKDLQEKLFYAPNVDEYYDPERNIQTNMSLNVSLSISDEEKYVVKANRLKIA